MFCVGCYIFALNTKGAGTVNLNPQFPDNTVYYDKSQTLHLEGKLAVTPTVRYTGSDSVGSSTSCLPCRRIPDTGVLVLSLHNRLQFN